MPGPPCGELGKRLELWRPRQDTILPLCLLPGCARLNPDLSVKVWWRLLPMGWGGTCVYPRRQHHQHPPPAPHQPGSRRGSRQRGEGPFGAAGGTRGAEAGVAGDRGGPAGVGVQGGGGDCSVPSPRWGARGSRTHTSGPDAVRAWALCVRMDPAMVLPLSLSRVPLRGMTCPWRLRFYLAMGAGGLRGVWVGAAPIGFC